jgi:signal transduction histidine kinase
MALLLATMTLFAVIVHLSTTRLIEQQVGETVLAEIRGLAEQYRDEGLPKLVTVIEERSRSGAERGSVYLLTDSRFRPIVGNLAAWPLGGDAGGWMDIGLDLAGDHGAPPHMVRARTFELAGGYHLLVGSDLGEQQAFRAVLGKALAWSAAPAVAFGLLGGFVVGRYALRRVDSVRLTGQEIVRGDLSQRVPVGEGGDEFDRLSQTINDMLDQIERLMAGMRLVTDSLAHDLRGPLTRAKGGIEMALRGEPDDDRYRHALAAVDGELDGILRTFDSLINIARAEAGVGAVTLERLDMGALVRDLGEVYQPIAEEAGLAFETDVAAATVRGHRQLLAQAVANLLDNAIKYTPAPGTIALSVVRRDPELDVIVSDTGPGVGPADRARVLDRFVRLDSARTAPGSGLGLSLVAAVARQHDARLVLEDNEPGLRVRLTFRIA